MLDYRFRYAVIVTEDRVRDLRRETEPTDSWREFGAAGVSPGRSPPLEYR